MWNSILKWAATGLLGLVKADSAEFEAFVAPYLSQGEAGIEAAATKFNPLLGLVVTSAITDLGPDVPQFEGDAVAWVEALLTAFIAKV